VIPFQARQLIQALSSLLEALVFLEPANQVATRLFAMAITGVLAFIGVVFYFILSAN